MPEVPILISSVTMANYFFTAFILSYIAPKIRIGRLFWYGLVAFFFIIFFHNMEMFMSHGLSGFSIYTLLTASFFLLASIAGIFHDKRIWLGEETVITRSLLMPSEIQMLEREKRLKEARHVMR